MIPLRGLLRPFAATLLAAFVVGSTTASGAPRPNHLLGQTSPYLLEHVQNPVDWYPWGDEAIGKARREGRPIFLSIGYSACHWCHVMAREVFEDEEIARILNDRFVSIKVDREERPDLDAIYMDAVVAMTGGGGWPMSVFLTPDLKPFYGGTYFPRDAFRERLLAIASAWDTHRQEALDAADGIQKLLVEQQRPPDPAGRAVPADLLLRDSARELALTFDRANGGFGGRPKFPPHGALWLLLQKHARSRDAGALEMVVRTLDGMARGGLYDQIGGGFHRYATDERWLVPHFEKMLYDNALLVPIYLEAWKVTGRIRFRRVAEETLAWVMREMADPGGGFCAALDADSEGREGAYYLWTADEVKGIVGPTDSALVIAYYGLTDGGRFEGGGSLPHVARSIDQLARERGLPEDVTRARLESARQKLMRARSRRVPPRRDGKILTAWNGLMISALARAYESTGVARYRAAAIGAADFLRLHIAGPDGSLRVSWTDGRPGPPGHLDDSAFLGRGLLDLHDVTGDERFLDLAALILGSASRFYDVRDGGYFFAEGGRPDLIVRTRSLDDGPLPSGSAVMVDCLARLSRALGDPSLLGPAARTLALAAPALQRSPLASPYMVLAALRMVGEEGGGASPPLARTAVAPDSLRDAPVLAAERTGAALPAGALGSAGVSHAGTAGTGEPPERLIRGSVVGRAGPQRVVESSILAPAGAVRPGQSVTLSVRLSIDRGWHVNSSRPTLSYLIPTRIEFPAPAAANVEEIAYPEGTLVSLKFADQKLSVFQGETTIRATISPPAGAPAGALAVKARLTYQACSDLACLAPETVEFAIPIRVEGEPVTRAQAPPGGSGPATAPPGGPASPAGGGIGALLGSGSKGGEGIKALLEERGLLMLLGVVFLAGLALNLTPCVYPMIPVTIGFFVNQASGSWRRRIGLPALYVLGMAVTYSILGVAAGLTGSLFGSLLQSPWVTGLLVLIFVVMALSMFGLFEIRMPAWLTRYSGGRRGAAGAFLMGLTMGIAAAPCIGPFIVPLLAFVGASGRPVLGFWLFFVMAIGMGLPNLLLGTFSGALGGLPRSGSWLLFAKKVMGVALLAVALYFLQPFLPDRRLGWIVLGFAGVSGVYLALLERTRIASAWLRPVKIAAGVATMVIGAWIALPLLGARPDPAWRPYSPEALERAKAGGRPVIIDFFASWCLPCKELDRFTFTDARVIDEAGRFVMLKADLSQFESQPVRDVRERFSVLGVPTVILIDGTGSERRDLRVYGFEDGAVFLGRMRQVR